MDKKCKVSDEALGRVVCMVSSGTMPEWLKEL